MVFLPLYIVLLMAAVVDHKTYRIPNICVLSMVLYGGIMAVGGKADLFLPCHTPALYPFSALLLILCMGWIPRFLGKWLKRSLPLGGGDVKLMGACGLFLSMEQVGYFLILTGVFGLLHRLIFKKDPIPLAPALGLAFFFTTWW